MLDSIIPIAILLSAIPVGFILAYLTKEELKSGRGYFESLITLSFIAGLVFLISRNYIIGLSLFYIAIVTLISLILSYKKFF